MNVAILSSHRGWHATDLVRALTERGHEGHVLPIDSLTARVGDQPRFEIEGTSLDSLDAIFLRTIPRGSLEQIIFRIDALHRIERRGVQVVNPARVIERTVDKLYTSSLLEEAGLRTPRTVVTERMDDAMAAFREMGDVVVKPLFGSNGRGIARVTDEEVAYRVFRALDVERAVYYIQQSIPHEGRDLRVFIVGQRVIAAIWRSASAISWCRSPRTRRWWPGSTATPTSRRTPRRTTRAS